MKIRIGVGLTLLASLLLVSAVGAVPTRSISTKPRIAIIIDDMGYDQTHSRQALTLPAGVTYSFIPLAPYTASLATLASQQRQEIMLHLPMESLGGPTRETRLLRSSMSRQQLLAAFNTHLAALPQAVGINNHMGSRLTADTDAMSVIMEAIKPTGLYFIDSRTTAATVAATLAERHHISQLSRDVFLDNIDTPTAIEAAFDSLLTKARLQGYAIAIGHPHHNTLQVLKQRLSSLAEKGYLLVPTSRLITSYGHTPAPALSLPTYVQTVITQPSPSTLQRIARASVD